MTSGYAARPTWKLDLDGDRVVLAQDDWHKRGDAADWLTSDVFDLRTSRSLEAEAALEEAAHALADKSFDKEKAAALHEKLVAVLPDTDPFWARWRHVGERQGWLSPKAGDR